MIKTIKIQCRTEQNQILKTHDFFYDHLNEPLSMFIAYSSTANLMVFTQITLVFIALYVHKCSTALGTYLTPTR